MTERKRVQSSPQDQEVLTPEQRTAAFFAQDPTAIADQLTEDQGMVIAEYGSDRKIRIVEVEAFPKSLVGKRYRAMDEMQPGDLWNPPVRRIRQSLIVAKDQDGVGACVRLLEARYLDLTTNQFVRELKVGDRVLKSREGDIANYFGLDKNEQAELKFLDDSGILYIVQ